MTSYQKLQKENKLLKQQLFTIAKNPQSLEAQSIIYIWNFKGEMAECMMNGTPQKDLLPTKSE